jgi:putative ABC transport system ATP-binding protein
MSLLEFKNVYFEDDTTTIIEDFNLKVEKNDFISIIGPSGSGKSTFLKLCSNLISPSKGTLFFHAKDYNSYDSIDLRKKIAYCFQTPYLFGDKVIENLNFPYIIRGKEPNLEQMYTLLSRFNLEKSILIKETKNLSGGEKQRIALIRTLLFPPEILLLDEVTSALDADNCIIVENEISRVQQDGMTILWITHNQEQSRKKANKLLTIVSGKLISQEVL